MAAPQVSILFGSQSGTAECFSEEIRDEAAQRGIASEVVDLQTFTPETFAARPLVVLVVSTYGEGEPSDNAVEFNKWASDPRNDGALKGQRFCVMGLGDMNYARFNNMGLMTDQNLERLGGERCYQRGLGDDSQDIHADFEEWMNGGLWEALAKAIAEVQREGRGAGVQVAVPTAAQVAAAAQAVQPEVHVFFGQEEADGAAKDICEAFTARAREEGLPVPVVQSLADRKAVETVRKLPKHAFAVICVDAGPEGMCSAGRKLVRNMNLEFDSNALADKGLHFALLAIASSKCNTSANALREGIKQGAEPMSKAFDRAGVKAIAGVPNYVDAGVESVDSVVAEFCTGLARAVSEAAGAAAPAPVAGAPAAAEKAAPAAAAAPKTRILCAGQEAREAAEALAAAWPGEACCEDASLAGLASAAQQRVQVVVAVECAADGTLADTSRGLAAMLGAAPMAVQAQLRQLRFALLAVAATDYGNAGERASANAARAELTRAASPVTQALTKFGARSTGSASLDLQDADPAKLTTLGASLLKGFLEGAEAPTARPISSPAAAFGTPVIRMAAAASDLPAEAPGEPADVLARFYFEADKSKVSKARELRQSPCAEEGLATVEVELEATGGLKDYALGGTLSLMPVSDPADVAAMLPILGLTPVDLGKWITFVAAEGSGVKVKRPFPTPCTLGEALGQYCDLGRPPSRKMLTALQPLLKDQAARDCVGKLLADSEAFKLLQTSVLCRMPDFWSMLGVTGISPGDFLLHCQRQKAREFTIASSPKATPGKITLCVSLTSQAAGPGDAVRKLCDAGCLPQGASLPAGRFFGACSGWLARRLKAGDVVLARQRPSALRLPDKDVPVIMVGAGAGVAPFRGFWEELRRGTRSAPAALFFGCRHPDKDWLFREDMSGAVKLAASGCSALARMQVGPKRPLTCLFTAFSRPGEGKESKYVQDHIRSQGQSVKHWIENMAGAVFICGSTAMGNGVLEALSAILEGGSERVEALRKEGRIVAEMWG